MNNLLKQVKLKVILIFEALFPTCNFCILRNRLMEIRDNLNIRKSSQNLSQNTVIIYTQKRIIYHFYMLIV